MPAADDLTFRCPKCQAAVRAQPAHAGQKVRCPQCGEAIKVPGVAPGNTSDDEDWFQLAPEPPPRPNWQSDKSRAAPESKPGGRPGPSVGDPAAGLPPNAAGVPVAKPPAAKPIGPPRATTPDAAKSSTRVPDRATSPAGVRPKGATPPRDPVAPIVQTSDEESEFRVRCHVCDASLIASAAEAGQRIRCPDCGTQLVVPPPPKRKAKPNVMRSVGPDLGLAPATERTVEQDAPDRKIASDVLAQAEAEYHGEDVDRLIDHLYENPRVGEWLAQAFKFIREPGALIRCLIGAGVGLGALVGAWGMLRWLPLPEQVNQALVAFAILLGWFGIGWLAWSDLSTSDSRSDAEESHPGIGAFGYASTLAVAVLPGVVILAISGPGLASLFFCLASAWLLWPLLLRWRFDQSSGPTQSATAAAEWLPKAYFATACLAFAALLAGVFANMLPPLGGALVVAVAWSILVFASGRLILALRT